MNNEHVTHWVSSFTLWHSKLSDLCSEWKINMLRTYFQVLGFGSRHSALGTRHSAPGTRHSALGTWLHTGFRVSCFSTQNLVICATSEKWKCYIHIFGSRASGLGTRHSEVDDLCNIIEKWTCCMPGFEFHVSALKTWWFVQQVKNGNVTYIFLGPGRRVSALSTRNSALGTRNSALGTWHLIAHWVSSFMFWHLKLGDLCSEWKMDMLHTYFWVPGFRLQHSALGTQRFV
jgi:hypothetical protein